MKNINEKFQEALDELRSIYETDKDHGRQLGQTVSQALIFLDKHYTNDFNPDHLATMSWPPPPTEKKR